MARERRRGLALYQRPRIGPLPSVGCVPCVPPFYTGRKRGEVVRTRTTVLQAHTHQWLASFGNPGNGQYREELRRAVKVIQAYVKAHDFPPEHALLQMSGQYGTGAVVSDLAGFSYVTRGKDYRLLDRTEVQARLHLPADQHLTQEDQWDLSRALRLSGSAPGQNRQAGSHHRRDPPCWSCQKSGRCHPLRRRL